MEGRIKTNVKLDYIQDFEMMFERMKLHRPREAAVYYVILVVDAPKEFSDFLKIAEELANITRRPLETGRNCLFKNGLIAKVLFSNSTTTFGRESYLPAHPQAIWENIKDDLRKYIAPETYSAIEHHLHIYNDYYQRNFERYGIKLKRNGNVTLEYNGRWIMYNVLHNSLQKGNQLKFQISGDRFFKEPFLSYFKKLLELDNKIQILVDSEVDQSLLSELKKIYGEKFELRAFPEGTVGTLRNYVFGKEFAINGIKILQDTDDPAYVGTAYVD
ncbi:MAG TPA: hypothetical protein ENG62_02585, partial [Thermoplasmatales archaeon]|nr:hypothetical protein [Thermoplasmatales archaeon]